MTIVYEAIANIIIKLVRKLTICPSKEIARVVKIYDTMHKVLDVTGVQRILIMKAHNGGGLIKPSTPLYVSVLYEDYEHPFSSVKDTYQKFMIDEHYLRLLLSLCLSKRVEIDTSNLPESSILRDVYSGEGVQHAEMHFLGQDKKNLYFCSMATSEDKSWYKDAKQKLAIQTAINSIRNSIL